MLVIAVNTVVIGYKDIVEGILSTQGWAGLSRMLIGQDSMWVDNHWVEDRSRFQLWGATLQEVKPTSLYSSH